MSKDTDELAERLWDFVIYDPTSILAVDIKIMVDERASLKAENERLKEKNKRLWIALRVLGKLEHNDEKSAWPFGDVNGEKHE